MSLYFKTAQGGMSLFPWAELQDLLPAKKRHDLPKIEGIGPMQDQETEQRLTVLRQENERLNTALAEADQRDANLGTIEALERQNEQLAAEAKARGLDKSMTDIERLRTLEAISKGVTTNQHSFAKQAEDLIESRVNAIAAERRIGKSQAYGVAAKTDPIAKQAYAMLTRSQDVAARANRASDALGLGI